ncbi:hypothetical protein U0070_025724 [Myodes glareolus]|uniref:Uncharacterized protein n=1 Tax=Myodes glareolus TaxID=447135 RepID=A0AAW0HEW0_MYOGA
MNKADSHSPAQPHSAVVDGLYNTQRVDRQDREGFCLCGFLIPESPQL